MRRRRLTNEEIHNERVKIMKNSMNKIKFGPLKLIKRHEWDPTFVTTPSTSTEVSTTRVNSLNLPVNIVLFSYTNTDECMNYEECTKALRELHQKSLDDMLPDIPYNFVVGGDGTVYEARGWLTTPEVNKTFPNIHGISIEIAHFGLRGRTPYLRMGIAAWDLVQYGVKTCIFGMRPKFFTDYRF